MFRLVLYVPFLECAHFVNESMGIRDTFKAAVGVSTSMSVPADPLGDGKRRVYGYNTVLEALETEISESLKAYANFALKDRSAKGLKEAASSSSDVCWDMLDASIRQYATFNKSCASSYDSLLKPQLVRLEGKVHEQLTHCQAALSKIEKRDRLYGKMIECKGELEKARTTSKGVEKAELYHRKAESDFESSTTEVEGLINSITAMHQSFLRDAFESLYEVQKNFYMMAAGEIQKIPAIRV